MNRDRDRTIDDRGIDDRQVGDREIDGRTTFSLSQSSEQQEFSIKFKIQLRFLLK